MGVPRVVQPRRDGGAARFLGVLIDPPGDGAWNMAVDEVLLEAAEHEGAWLMRFYGWRRPTISLGYAQPWRDAFDPFEARRRGIPVVRRPTGGRAVLHADELTYSVAGPTGSGPLAGGIGSSYRLISAGLRAGLQELGAVVELERGHHPAARRGPCFAARARFELASDGRKLVGSAQRRRGGALLQHGSMPLGKPDAGLWRALGEGHEEAAVAAIGLVEVLGNRPSRRLLVACLARGVAAALGLAPRRVGLSAARYRQARRWRRRYRSAAWTMRR